MSHAKKSGENGHSKRLNLQHEGLVSPCLHFYHFGDEEFIIILPDTDADDGVSIMTRLRRDLAKRNFLHDNTKVLITFSAGGASALDWKPQTP